MSLGHESPRPISSSAIDSDEYQAISVSALAAMVAGLASPVALLAVPFWIVPLVGILLSCLALVRIERSSGALTGRAPALVGLALSIGFATAAVTAHFNAQRLVAAQASQAAMLWLKTLAGGEPELAHQWTLAPRSRAGLVDPSLLKALYANDKDLRTSLAKFVADKPIALLLAAGPQTQFRRESTTGVDERLDTVSETFRVAPGGAGEATPLAIEIVLEKLLVSDHDPRWVVRRWRLVEPSSGD